MKNTMGKNTNYTFFWIIQSIAVVILLFISGCSEPLVLSPPSELPPITYEGANTFGCEIDGKVYVAFSDNFQNQATHSYLMPEFFSVRGTLSLQGNDRDVHKSVQIYIPAIEWSESDTMSILGSTLLYPTSSDTSSGKYLDLSGDNLYYTSPSSGGELKILFRDYTNRTLTGVFWFNAINIETGDTVRIRNGRFDVKY